ncbi:MAG: hypothetical protein ABIQ06_07915 [Caldimonas sp.]
MNLIAGARWLLTLGTRRASRRHGSDPADMGTAFGLDATTTLEPETPAESQLRDDSARPSRFELRLHRRSTL